MLQPKKYSSKKYINEFDWTLFIQCKALVLMLCELLGDLHAEDVLQWLILQKTEDRIETVTRGMLENIVQNVQYLAVYFC